MHHDDGSANGIHHAAGDGVGRGGGEGVHFAGGAVEVGGFGGEGFFHEVEAGHDGAAEVMVVFGEGVGGYGGAAANDDAGVLAKTAAAQGVEPAVGAVFGGVAVVVADAERLRHGGQPADGRGQVGFDQGFFEVAAHGAADDTGTVV